MPLSLNWDGGFLFYTMDHKLLNLAEAAGMTYTGGRFVFTYEQLAEFYRLAMLEHNKI